MHCVPLTEMRYAARLLNWGFAMDGKVTPVGTLARPRPAPAAGGTGPAAAGGGAGQHGTHQHGAGQQAAHLIQPAGFATIPVSAWIGVLALAALVGAGVAVLRRRAGGGSPPGP
jgi:D-alanyl-D-alanine carboxypeptidase (penicillin-binding protein 5/6)